MSFYSRRHTADFLGVDEMAVRRLEAGLGIQGEKDELDGQVYYDREDVIRMRRHLRGRVEEYKARLFRTCSEEGCEEIVYSLGFCDEHYRIHHENEVRSKRRKITGRDYSREHAKRASDRAARREAVDGARQG